jgi:hypothetical protein
VNDRAAGILRRSEPGPAEAAASPTAGARAVARDGDQRCRRPGLGPRAGSWLSSTAQAPRAGGQ